jgi:hypothetical protein
MLVEWMIDIEESWKSQIRDMVSVKKRGNSKFNKDVKKGIVRSFEEVDG